MSCVGGAEEGGWLAARLEEGRRDVRRVWRVEVAEEGRDGGSMWILWLTRWGGGDSWDWEGGEGWEARSRSWWIWSS